MWSSSWPAATRPTSTAGGCSAGPTRAAMTWARSCAGGGKLSRAIEPARRLTGSAGRLTDRGHAEDLPAEVREAGGLGRAIRRHVARIVQVDRDGALGEDPARGLGDKPGREAPAAVLVVGADRQLEPGLVVALDADSGH